ncbi:MAG: CoA pyrophosphatase [Deltaproteobacteria bacterium]|nr:CoA pyrophosphatase [Deltaproteobacteria bacterium]
MMDFANFVTRLEAVAARGRIMIHRPDLTPSAVLVPVVERDGAPSLILTRRTMKVAAHKGEISFPGGVREPEDRDAVATALRESREEIGLDPGAVRVLGPLDDMATTTGFVITPVLGIVRPDAALAPEPVEVAEVVEAPFADLMDPARHELVTEEFDGASVRYHRYRVAGLDIWGATAWIIHRLLVAFEEA